MNKFYFFSILITFTVGISNAQRFEGGVVGGLTASQVDGDSYSGFNKLGIHFGAFTKTQFNPRWGAQMELKYSGRGAFQGSLKPNEPKIYQLSLRYIEIPVIAQFYLTEEIFFDGGVSFGYLMGRKMYDNGGLVPDEEIKRTGEFDRFDLNGIIGINYTLNENITLNIQYAYSAIPIRERETTGNYYYGHLARIIGYTEGDYNNFLTFGAYYKF